MGSLTPTAESLAGGLGAARRVHGCIRPASTSRSVTIVGGGTPVRRLVRLILSELNVTCAFADGVDEVRSDLVIYCCARLEPETLVQARRQAFAPLVVLTTDDGEEAHARARDLGVDAVVLMPFDPEQLLGLASYLLPTRYEIAPLDWTIAAPVQ